MDELEWHLWPRLLLESLVQDVRRETHTKTMLQGRRWLQAGPAWLAHQRARGHRWLTAAVMTTGQWDYLAAAAECEQVRRRHRSRLQPGNPFHARVLEQLEETVVAVP